MNEKNTPISDFGKYGLIEHITKGFDPRDKTTMLGIGDDAAALDNGKLLTLVSTDLLLEGIHFNLVYTPMKHLGYKSVVRGISDIYAMNGTPRQLFLSLGISSRFSVEQVEDFYSGIKIACEKYNIDLAGGDITSSVTGLTISVTATGTVLQKYLIKRSTALPNDLICVTGDFGAAFMGLQLLERERRLFVKDKNIQPDLSGYNFIIGKQLKPEFPAALLRDLSDADILPTAMTDVTEGLASDLIQICKNSGTGCRIFYSRVPIDYETSKLAEEFGIDPMTPALNGGEDYELLFTVSLENADKIRQMKSVRIIGHMTMPGTGCYIEGDDGSEIELSAQGWKRKKQ